MLNIIMVKLMALKKYDKAFLTGCDENTEWMLDWFIDNLKKHKNTSPVIFADFGVSDKMIERIREEKKFHAVINMRKASEKGWFLKRRAMMSSPSKKTVWIDTDCEILDNIEDLFDMLEPGKLAMVEDKPWTKRTLELWHNSGVVGFIDKPIILHEWCKAIQLKKNVVAEIGNGDQEVLHSMLNPITKLTYIKDLPNEYNVVRVQVDNDNYQGAKKIMHWTGEIGKIKIRSMIDE